MKQLFIGVKQQFCFLILALSLCLYACSTGKKLGDKSPHLREGVEVCQDEFFMPLKTNISRFHQLNQGKFVHYKTVKRMIGKEDGSEEAVYSNELWLNRKDENNDSVLLYSFPVGEPSKDGYWVYYYQFMTALPNEPLYEAFINFKEESRDVIKGIFYDSPDTFNVPIADLLENPNAHFSNLDLSLLPLSKTGEGAYYRRESPTHFKGESKIYINHQNKSSFRKDFYQVIPEGIRFETTEHEDSTRLKESSTKQNNINFLRRTGVFAY